MSHNNLRQINYQIRLRAPVLISNTVGDENVTMSESHLAGTSLLGMFANLYLQRKGNNQEAHKDPVFKTFFLSNALRFLNGYPESHDHQRLLPIPISVQSLKHNPDVVFETMRFDEQEAEKNKTKYRAGYGAIHKAEKKYDLEKVTVDKTYNFHHQRTNPLVGRSTESEIFNYEAIEWDQTFVAALIGEKKTLEEFLALFNGAVIPSRLGRSKNSQYGAVEIRFLKKEPQPINELPLSPGWKGEKPPEREISRASFVLTLLSHTILHNEFGHAVASAAALESFLTARLSSAELPVKFTVHRSYLKKVDIENYVAVWRARRPQVSALQMGSCFEFKITPELSELQRKLLQEKLAALQQEGIGIRRNEGFGRFAINWHGVFSEIKLAKPDQEVQRKQLDEQLAGKEPPTAFGKIFEQIFETAYLEKARALAAEELNGFNVFPPGSQISRLQQFALQAKALVQEHEKKTQQACFIELIERLPRTTREKLAGIYDSKSGQSLWDFMQQKNFSAGKRAPLEALLQKDVQEQNAEARLMQRIGFDPVADAEFRDELFKTFMATFFALMSYKAKTAQGGKQS